MNNKSAIIIGSGFGGLGSACILAKAGWKVTVYEKNEQVGGRASVFEAIYDDKQGKYLEMSPEDLIVDAMQGAVEQRSETYKKVRLASSAGRNAAEGSPRREDSSWGKERGEEVFRFDMGPSWYLMPDVFEHFFNLLGEKVEDHLKLKKLAPSYRIFYKDTETPSSNNPHASGQPFLAKTSPGSVDVPLGRSSSPELALTQKSSGRNHTDNYPKKPDKKVDIYSDLSKDLPTIEKIEKGAGEQLKKYLEQSGYQYSVAKDRFMYKNYNSIRDFFTREMATEGRKLSVLANMDRHVKKYFKTDQMQKIMQYPLVFLGSSPYNTPAIYNIMSHIDFNMGVYYPKGGIYEITKALRRIAEKNGAKFEINSPVSQIIVQDDKAVGVKMENGERRMADIIISNADVHHTESALLQPQYRTKSARYWQKRTLAPSALIMYLGVKGKVPSLTHHNLLFSKNWKQNFAEIFNPAAGGPEWPTDPSLYICNPSKTDSTVAPAGHENLFVLVPIAPGLEYTNEQLENYANKILATMEEQMNMPNLRQNIVFKKLFSVKDFAERYNSLNGTALGLAHTLRQTAIFRPNNISKKVKNLYYVGANTNPGIGMPITLISAELMYKRLISDKTAGPLTPKQLQ